MTFAQLTVYIKVIVQSVPFIDVFFSVYCTPIVQVAQLLHQQSKKAFFLVLTTCCWLTASLLCAVMAIG